MGFNLQEQGAILEEGSKGWNVEVNIGSWYDNPPGYDIRAWDENHEKCGKGITLSEKAILNLRDYLNKKFPPEV